MARPSRRTVTLLAIIVAVVGLRPLADLLGAPRNLQGEAAAALGGAADPSDLPSPADLEAHRPTILVLARQEDWVKYIDLIIRVLAVVLAWFLGGKPEPAPPKPVSRAHHA